jgi:glycosyltransferase involved in cell wall biosynthesis
VTAGTYAIPAVITAPSTTTFTVVISTHNRPEGLRRAVESVLAQTWDAFELIVIENGSTDATPEVAQSFTDPRYTCVINPMPTASCDVPRNMGIERSRGTYVAFLDDDDVWYPEKLARVKAMFDADASLDAVCHDEYQRTNGIIDGTLSHGPWDADVYECLLYQGNVLSSCATTIKRSVLQRLGGFDARLTYDGVADYDFWLRMARDGRRVGLLHEPLGEFCMTGENWSVRDAGTSARLANIITDHMHAYEKRPLWRMSTRALRRLVQMYGLAARQYLRAGVWGQGIVYTLRTVWCAVWRPVLIVEWLRRRTQPVR